jgi:TorA maturation chaperone TorD
MGERCLVDERTDAGGASVAGPFGTSVQRDETARLETSMATARYDGRDTAIEDGAMGAVRAQEYLLLATLLRAPPSEALLADVAGLTGDASPLGMAHVALAEAARRTTARDVGREYFDVFVGVGRGELLPYASFYLTGFLNERPLARVRTDLAALGIVRSADNHDPEDHIATVLETMALLAAEEVAADGVSDATFFARHVTPWVARFFADLAVAPSARFYASVATVGLTFVDIETAAFTITDTPARATRASA